MTVPPGAASDRLTTIDPATIATVIEANLNAYPLSFGSLPGATVHRDSALAWVDAGVPTTECNAVVLARFEPEHVDAQIESVLDHFRRQSRPFAWHVGPTSQPADLGRSLLAHGLSYNEDEPGMAIEIATMRDEAPPADLTIATVDDEGGLADWVAVWLFPVDRAAWPFFLDILLKRGLGDHHPWRYYVGYVDGKPVATSLLFVAEGVTAVHYVVTIPEERRRGIGAAMTRHVLREAQALGYHVAVLTASPYGVGIYRRLGFQEYCTFSHYEWEPPSE